MKKKLFILGMLLSSVVLADAEDRTLTDKEIMECRELGNTAGVIQDIRNTTSVEVWDFYYKNKDLLQVYSPDAVWHLIRKVYHVAPKGAHPAQVSRHLFGHCTKFTYDSKPEVAYNI